MKVTNSQVIITSLLATTALAVSKDTGALDDNLNEQAVSSSQVILDSSVAATTKSTYKTALVAASVVEGSATALDVSITSVANTAPISTYSAALVQTTNVVSNSNNQYADKPSFTVVTTNELGQTTTEYKWWVPSVATTQIASATASGDVESDIVTSSTVEDTSALVSAIADSSVVATATESTEVASSTSKYNNGPVTTVTSVDSLGKPYTSTLWWVPTTTYSWEGESKSSNTIETGSTTVKTIKSVYVTSASNHKVTYTSDYLTTVVNKAKETTSSNHSSTMTVHSNHTNGINHINAINGLKYVAIAALLL